MLTKINKKYSFLLLLADVLLILVSIFLAPIIRFHDISTRYYDFSNYHIYIVFWINLFVLYLFHAFDLNLGRGRFQTFANFLISYIIIGGIIAAAIFMLPPDIEYGRGIWFIQLGISFVLIEFAHILFYTIAKHRFIPKRIIIIGESERIDILVDLMEKTHLCTVIGYIGKKCKCETEWLGGVRKFNELINFFNPEAILLLDVDLVNRELERKLLQAKMKGLYIYDLPSLFENLFRKIPVKFINDNWLLYSSFRGLNSNEYNQRFKRLIDICLSLFGLIAASWLMLLTAIIVKLESRGPVFYQQVRVGLNEKHFKIIKFRSMVHNAEKHGVQWASVNDSRVTFFGKIIRKTRIDEIPQLWNVLRGDMSLIGPRPERPEFVEMLKKEIPYYSLRHMIKPGVSGWAQVNYPYGASVEDALQKLEYDLFYMRHLTLQLDLNIILRTFRTIFFAHGSR